MHLLEEVSVSASSVWKHGTNLLLQLLLFACDITICFMYLIRRSDVMWIQYTTCVYTKVSVGACSRFRLAYSC
jgi:hypothetical protein